MKSGSGKKYVFWDADLYKYTSLKALLSEVGSQGSLSLFKDRSSLRTEFCIQMTNEKLKGMRTMQDGRTIYTWKTFEPHDFLDTVGQAYAIAASQGISSSLNFIKGEGVKRPVMMRRRKKVKVKIV